MDWSKTKNILILGLLITNLVLAFYIYKSEALFNRSQTAEKISIQDVISILEKKNVYINMENVNYFAKLNDVEVTYDQHLPDDVATKILGTYEKKGDTYFGGKYRIDFSHDNIEMNMRYAGVELPGKAPTVEDGQVIAENFIKLLGYTDKDMVLAGHSTDGHTLTLVYRKTYKELFLEDSFMKVMISNRNVVAFNRKWLDVTNVYDSTRRVIPPSKALFMFFDQIGYSDKPMVITGIDLGYRLGGEQFTAEIRSGDALPYWRITTKSGQVFYIEAVE